MELFNIENVYNIYKNIDKTDEVEVMFNNYRNDDKLTIEDFIRVSKMVKLLSKEQKKPLKQTISLDVVYSENNLVKYRVSVEGLDKINQLVNLVHQRSNNIILTVFLSKVDNKHVFVMKKTKDIKNIYDQDNLNIRFRKSKEEPLTKNELDKISNLTSEYHNNIHFRFKNRISYVIPTSVGDLSIDLTITQNSVELKKVKKEKSNYEIEMELYPTKKVDKKGLEEILQQVINVKKVLMQNTILGTKISTEKVIENYRELVYKNKEYSNTNLYSMQPISAEVQHLVDKVPNNYSATDKADGKKNVLFVTEGEVFLIDNTLQVKPTGMKVKDLDNTILEGELIFLPKKQMFLMMNFDILYYKGENQMDLVNLKDRLNVMIKAINQITGEKEKLVEEYQDKFDMNKMRHHYHKQIKNFYDELDKQIKKSKKGDIIIKPKCFFFPSGGSPSEIFMFADLIWESCTEDETVLCPYMLDGIIFTGLEQKYTPNKKDWKLPIYKFKPPSQNSLDVYVTFPKNADTGEYLQIFDNSRSDLVKGQNYRIANFFVGDKLGTREVPVPFMKEDNNHEGYFPIDKGQVRDIEGDIIQDKTVIEIAYHNDPNVDHPYRWQILRTRWDKTDSVNRHQKRYGNFRDVAIKTWKSMKEAVTWNEIKALANPDSYQQQSKQLQTRIDTSIISSDRQQDAYYQKISNLCQPMRKFHNWVKSIMIYTHAAKKQSLRNGKEQRLKVLDIGCGRGGDIMKMYHPRVGYYVGVDLCYDNIHSPNDGALARYKIFKDKFPDFPKMEFIQGDAGVEFNGAKQKQRLGNMKLDNMEMINKSFNKNNTFDLVNAMFSIHYLFADDSSLENLCSNINNHLKPGGFIIMTLFDGEKVHNLLENEKNNTFTTYYTDDEGKKTKLFEIIKKYKGTNLNRTGLALDIHMAWISEEGKYETEYLVTKDFMIETMKNKCNVDLIETDTFENLFHINKPWFDMIINVEENLKNRKFYNDVYQFYGDLRGADKESKKYSFLYRYFVFQKKY
ncbi:putative mRNA capping enzyme [Cafeteria roenbergensis virus]|uniref:Putative mRNA capping enzyme n=1 Tax=Cafeteria roenbergensis virus (strain BV-PW1) TaxID=693272 RepID=E3T4Y2_CROVB|nr:putative mRNA capping enzyme [Cafeteria roenbergensis virus BV-PW1]ADO67245.1 putative mRNA capping enzyme [Cafeteria roenbergensis virus BV-PW1]